MKEPVKARSTGLVFEQSTIELWLATRGSVCPISNTQLEKSDLVPDDELRNRYAVCSHSCVMCYCVSTVANMIVIDGPCR